jgi:hypothetical protein
MHRFNWDLHFDPISEEAGRGGGGGSSGAVPHRTYSGVNAPWAPPGSYKVRLTVDGKSLTQPITLRLDPRVKTPAAGLAQLASLSRQLYDGASASHAAYLQARSLSAQLQKLSGADVVAFKAQVDSLAPAPVAGGRGGRGGGRGAAAPSGPATLESASSAMMTAAMAMQSADVTPTATEVSNADRARTAATAVMARWTKVKSTGLAAFNAKRKAAGESPVILSN